MKFKKRKMICMGLLVCLIFTMVCPSFGASAAGSSLESAILKVKGVIDISDDYDNFNYRSSEYTTADKKTITVWTLDWDNGRDSIYAQVDGNGNIIYLSHYMDTDYMKISDLTRQEAEKTAVGFLNKVLDQKVAENMKIPAGTTYDGDSSSYRFPFVYHVNGEIPYSYFNVYVSVDKSNGMVTDYNGLNPGQVLPEFDSADGILSSEEAEKAWIDKVGAQLQYRSNYQYREKALNIFPAYVMSSYNIYIDGVTGEAVLPDMGDFGFGYGYADGAGGFGMAKSAEGSDDMSVEELTAVAEVSGLMSRQQAVNTVKDKIPVGLGSESTQASLYKDDVSGRYVWNFYFTNGSASIDAKTGELLTYWNYGEVKGNKKVSEEAARQTAEAFIRKNSAEKFEQSEFYISPSDRLEKLSFPPLETSETWRFEYNRIVDGIPFADNGFYVTVSEKSGEIIDYSVDWYEDAVFPSISGALSPEGAGEKILDHRQLELQYIPKGDGKASIAYGFSKSGATLFDPVTGAAMSYDGKPYKETAAPVYTDIGGTWCETVVNTLLENGYYLDGEEFAPGTQIKQKEFFAYLYTPYLSWQEMDDIYDMIISNGILTDEEKDPEKAVTRQEAAKYAIRYLELGLAGEQSDIYKNPFNDTVSSEYLGYTALSNALGIMKGDRENKFNGTAALTRGEAAVVIYNTLSAR